MQRIERTFVIVNSLGMHARPAAMLVQAANRFRSEVVIDRDGTQVNAKSIMGVLTLAASKGTQILLSCEGEDAAEVHGHRRGEGRRHARVLRVHRLGHHEVVEAPVGADDVQRSVRSHIQRSEVGLAGERYRALVGRAAVRRASEDVVAAATGEIAPG